MIVTQTINKEEEKMQILTELLDKLSASLETAKTEAEKFSKGTKSSAGKIRKEAQTSKKIWQEIRVAVMEKLKEMPVKKKK